MGALVVFVTYIIMGVPYYNYGVFYPRTLFCFMMAPTWGVASCLSPAPGFQRIFCFRASSRGSFF